MTAVAARQIHRVGNVVLKCGELGFDVAVAGLERRLFLRTTSDLLLSSDAILPTVLVPAMSAGGRLEIDADISARVLRGMEDYQAIQAMWSRDWAFGVPPLRHVEIDARAVRRERPRTGRVATFFSGGADSWWAILNHPDVTDLILIRGCDLRPDHMRLAHDVESRLRAAAEEMGRDFTVVETNLRWDFSEQLVPWENFFAGSLYAVALLLGDVFDKVYLAGDTDYSTFFDYGLNPIYDHLWGTESTELVHVGAVLNRAERIRAIVDEPLVRSTLRICWENPDQAYNCGGCRKCLCAMTTLEALGVRDRFPTFPDRLDPTEVAGAVLTTGYHVTMWREVLGLTRAAGLDDLTDAVAQAVAAGERRLPRDEADDLRAETERLRACADALRTERDQLGTRLARLEGSRSWRATAPLRVARRLTRG